MDDRTKVAILLCKILAANHKKRERNFIPFRPISPEVKASAKNRRERLAQKALEALRNPANHHKTR